MQSEIMPFEFEGSQVRVKIDEVGNPWWVTSDVAKIFGIENVGNLTRRLESNECSEMPFTDVTGRVQMMSVINESGLYHAIFRSNKPEAKRFRKWVFGEVLPQIRKTGRYQFNNASMIAASPNAQIQEIIELHEMLAAFYRVPEHVKIAEATKALRRLGMVQAEQYLLAAPAMSNIPENEMYLEPTELGRRHKLSAIKMNRLLAAMGLQAKIDSMWTPTDKAEGLYMKHSWTVGQKSGYNLKWNVSKIESMVTQFNETSDVV